MKTAYKWLRFCTIVGTVLFTQSAWAQAQFPTKAITIVVPYTPGGTTDLLARKIAQGMAVQLNQPVIVENRPGASTAVAAAYVARSASDGYTMLMASNATLAINPYTANESNYSARDSFDYVSLLAAVPNVIVVAKDSPYRNLADLVEQSKIKKGGVSYGSMGAGTSNHLGMEALGKAVGAQFLHVPYKGSAPALSDLMGGHVDVVVDTLVATLPHIKAGALRGLAILSSKRSPATDIPTVNDSVAADVNLYSWFGLVVPNGTPPGIIDVLSKSAVTALQQSETRDALEQLGVELVGSAPQGFKEFVAEQYSMYGGLVKDLDVKF